MRQVDENYSPLQLEKELHAHWEKNRIYEKVKRAGESGKAYYFLDGPPYTTGSIHIGTAWNKILKDTMVRYRRMQGLNVRDQPGYDMHGLPIEVKVEQALEIKSKKEIESHGMDKFVNTCREYAIKQKAKMTDGFRMLGIWMDWEQPYLTVDPSYMATVWWTLKQAHDKQLLMMDLRVLPWCPRCETALAEAEIEYWDETDPSIYVRFPLEGQPDTSFLVWTTTPWTIPGNLAAAVHPDFDYAVVRVRRAGDEELLLLLEEKVEELRKIAGIDEVEITERAKGKDLIGMKYSHPLADLVPYQKEVKGDAVHAILTSETVTSESTGIVHIAPGHGPEDFDIGKAHDLEPFSPVDESGEYTSEAGEHFAGRNVRDANAVVMKDLSERGALFHEAAITHRYGHCWRCKKPIIYRITDQWFLKVSEFKDKLDDINNQVIWYPDWAGASREKDWISNARDWCISRQRYWGTPLPIWRCECGNVRIVSSLEELRSARGYVDGMDVHRPWIDRLTYECDKCHKTMNRVSDVLDVWFDAGVCSWASLKYPAEKAEFEKWWPAEWITEAHDQTRGWFYSQLVTGYVAFGKSPYKSVLMHGWALTSQGQAMSKSEGTAVDPVVIVNSLGSDSLRFYLLKANAPWEDLAFQQEGVKSANRTLNILWNVYKFAALYMSIDEFDPASVKLDSITDYLRPEDRWMLSRMESLKQEVSSAMDSYELHRASRAIEDFVVADLSRWYVKLVRDRLWKEGEDRDKLAAFKVLHEALTNSALLMAPIAPHITDAMYANLVGKPESVHLARWPEVDESLIDPKLQETMAMVREISEIVARMRQEADVNLRWPLMRLVVKAADGEVVDALASLKDPLLTQNNIKDLQFVPVGEEWDELILSVVPNPNAIGKVYRQWASKIAVLLKNRPARTIKAGIDKGEYSLGIEGQLVKILPNMVSFSTTLPPDVVSADFSKGTIYLDLEQTPELEAEGFSREVIRRVQQMRKDMKLDVEEYIRVELECSRKVEGFLDSWRDRIARETRAKDLEMVQGPKGEYIVEWNIDTETLVIALIPLRERKPADVTPVAPKEPEPEPAPSPEKAAQPVQEPVEEPPEMPQLPAVEAQAVPEIPAPPEPSAEVEKAAEPSKPTPSPAESFVEDLKGVEGMDAALAEAVFAAGYVSRESMKTATVADIAKVRGMSEPIAMRLVEHFAGAAVVEAPAAAPEAKAAPEVKDLERSFSYLVEEDKPETSYNLFLNAMKKGLKGYCITRNYPAKIRTKFDLRDTPVTWLSNVGRENTIRPKDLEKLSLTLEQFLSQAGGGIVLLDGIEYLITNNNFITVLRLIQSLRDQVAINQSILLMAVNKSTLESHQLNLLEREVDYTITG